ncbi:MAG: peptidylprolyl isomerase [Siculibacillus sp.]|nr:peptidylprolyl isomerase [Siculibacillus sp.]
MNGHRRIVATVALLAGLVAPVAALAQDKVFARIDGQPITDKDVAAASTALASQLAQLPEDARKRAVVDRLIDMRVAATAATKAGLDQSDAFKARMDQVRTQLLIAEFLKAKVETAITEEVIKARYDKDVKAFDPPEEIQARHILVKTEDEAKKIIADLAKGGDFAAIAKEKSEDPGSATQGGDLGFFAPGDMVPEFETAAKTLAVGEVTKAPVKSQFGWHVIKLEGKRKQPVPALADVRDQVKQALVGETFSKMLEDLKKAAKIEVDEAAIKAK